MHFSTLFSTAALVAPTLAGYALEDDYMTDFYGHFDFFTDADPTHGFVKYVDESTSRSMGLINASTTVPVEWGVDTVNKDSAGRSSVRLTSKKSYNKGLVVMDVQHMPFGCGTWPAFWMVGPDWPNGGEIDILEGVNEQDTNGITLHTSSGCSIATDAVFNGAVDTSNCDVKAPDQPENTGCSIKQKSTQSYGAGLNSNGGGVFATEWTSDAISIYFFPRGEVPKDALGDAPDPSGWGTPAAKFANSGCNIDKYFQNQQIVFDTTFCGDWAGNVWSSGSCASKAATCNDFVQNNPEAFVDAHWTINALKVYQNDGSAAKPSEPATPPQKSSAIPVPTGVSSEVPIPSNTGVQPVVSSVEPPKETSDVVPIPSSSDAIPVPSNTVPAVSPSAPAGTGSPSGFHRTRHGHGRPTASIASDAAAPTVGAANGNVAQPSKEAGDGDMGGFTWPAHSGGNAETETAAIPSASGAPFPVAGNSTIPALPTGTGLAQLSSIDYSTVAHFSMSSQPALSSELAVPSETGASVQPTDLEAMPSFGDATPTPYPTNPVVPTPTGEHEVIETVYQTVVVTVTPGETPAPGSRRARHARAHRRRMVAHNGRK